MAQGEFTREECRLTKEAVNEIFDAIPKSKQMDYLGHLNDVLLFLEAAEKEAPEENEQTRV